MNEPTPSSRGLEHFRTSLHRDSRRRPARNTGFGRPLAAQTRFFDSCPLLAKDLPLCASGTDLALVSGGVDKNGDPPKGLIRQMVIIGRKLHSTLELSEVVVGKELSGSQVGFKDGGAMPEAIVLVPSRKYHLPPCREN